MNHDLLTTTFLRLRSRLQAMASRLLADESAADDALQEAFYKLWERRQAIVSLSQAEGMSVVAVRNTCIDALRRDSRTRQSTLDDVSLDIIDDTGDDRTELYESVKAIIENCLSPREKAVITMRDTMGMDFAEIADELGISESNTRMILSRARKTVREIYLSSTK